MSSDRPVMSSDPPTGSREEPADERDNHEPPRDEPASVLRRLEDLGAELRELRALFAERLRYDEVRELQIRLLHDELDGYKRNQAAERMLILAHDLIMVVDQLDEQFGAPALAEPSDRRFIRDQLLEALARSGIEQLSPASTDSVDAAEQVIGHLPPDSSVARQVVSPGYRLGERVVRPTRVLLRSAGGATPGA